MEKSPGKKLDRLKAGRLLDRLSTDKRGSPETRGKAHRAARLLRKVDARQKAKQPTK